MNLTTDEKVLHSLYLLSSITFITKHVLAYNWPILTCFTFKTHLILKGKSIQFKLALLHWVQLIPHSSHQVINFELVKKLLNIWDCILKIIEDTPQINIRICEAYKKISLLCQNNITESLLMIQCYCVSLDFYIVEHSP